MGNQSGATTLRAPRDVQTVLIVDDSETARQRMTAALREAEVGHNFLAAASATEALRMLAEHDVSLVLCDIEMPDMDGYNFLRLKGSKPEFLGIPVIMVTVRDNMDAKIRGLSEGASDYLTKPFEDQELVARARVHLHNQTLQTELRRRNARLEQISRTDELTGLSNRRHFMEVIDAEFARCTRYQSPLSLVLLDLDHFKTINDTFGHVVGDGVLAGVGATLTDLLRKCDSAARYGGEEFALLLPETVASGAMVVAERCRQVIEETDFEGVAPNFRVTASFGVAAYPEHVVGRVEDLIRKADQALYLAKGRGRNQAVSIRGADI